MCYLRLHHVCSSDDIKLSLMSQITIQSWDINQIRKIQESYNWSLLFMLEASVQSGLLASEAEHLPARLSGTHIWFFDASR